MNNNVIEYHKVEREGERERSKQQKDMHTTAYKALKIFQHLRKYKSSYMYTHQSQRNCVHAYCTENLTEKCQMLHMYM